MAGRIPNLPRVPLGAIVGGAGAVAALGGAGYLAFHSVYNVKPGEKAIVFNRLYGVKDFTYSEGTHLAMPWFEWPIIFDVRTRPRAIKSTTGTRDLQMVDIGLRVLTRPDAAALPTIYRKLGLDYDDKVLPSIVNEVVKQVRGGTCGEEDVSSHHGEGVLSRAPAHHLVGWRTNAGRRHPRLMRLLSQPARIGLLAGLCPRRRCHVREHALIHTSDTDHPPRLLIVCVWV